MSGHEIMISYGVLSGEAESIRIHFDNFSDYNNNVIFAMKRR